MNHRLAACVPVAALLVSAAAALESQTADYSKLPPAPEEIADALNGCDLSLTQAIDIAQRSVPDSKAASAAYNLDDTPPTITVDVYNKHTGFRVVMDAMSGKIVSQDFVPRFPGMPEVGDWTETDSGLRYYDIAPAATDDRVADNSALQMHFGIWLVDGTELGNTRSQGDGEPAELLRQRLGVPGWVEGMEGMGPGSIRKLIIPASLAFGERGQQGIPPNATLIVDVELLAIDPYAAVPDDLPGDPVDGEMVTTDSGLMYYDIVKGDGPQPSGPRARVQVHYTGYLNDGKKFDSSRDRGEPTAFTLSGVIPGWTEGVGSMRLGGKRKLIIPYNLAYGEAGRPGSIPPKATLIFDVELLEITEPDEPQG
jgi:peptidylprolyl isomerase